MVTNSNNILRYISTLVDNKSTCLCLSMCNYCPYFKLNPSIFESYCCNNNNKLLEKIKGYSYINGNYYPLSNISIPNWCNLSSDFFEIICDEYIYIKKYGNIVKEENIQISKDIIYDINVKYNGYELISFHKNDKMVEPVMIKKICSMCGEEKNDVDRYNHFGMCCVCRNNFKLDDDKNNFVFMNNFRLKRKSNYSKESFKKIYLD